ncbi:MAG: hypothetical protein QW416_03175 [Candidatus Nitrosocaldaceae archaeon]
MDNVDALKNLGLEYEQITRGKKNSIEFWFCNIRDAKAFYNNFQLRSSIRYNRVPNSIHRII